MSQLKKYKCTGYSETFRSGWTIGKVYTEVNGKLRDDSGLSRLPAETYNGASTVTFTPVNFKNYYEQIKM